MGDAGAMGAIEGIADLNGDGDGVCHRQHRRSLQPRRQGLALEVLEHDVVEIAVAPDVMNRADVRIVERGNRSRLLLEALARFRVSSQGAGQNLDGNRAIKPGIAGSIHLAHAALTDGRNDFVRAETATRVESQLECILSLKGRGEGARLSPRPSSVHL